MAEEKKEGFSFTDGGEDYSLTEYLIKDKHYLSEEDETFCQEYTEKLASFGLAKLSNILENTESEKERLITNTQTLAFENYPTFIQAAKCSKEIYKYFNTIDSHLDSTIERLPQFTNKLHEFAKHSQGINSCRKQNSMVLNKHTQLLEILEVPQLMNTCVRNNYYEEALELMRFVRGLEKKFSNIPVIKDISENIKGSAQLMLNQLLEQLRDNIKLPACLRIVSYIRLLEAFTEQELRVTFLLARESWFKGLIDKIQEANSYNYLVRVIETNRVNLFDIVTQYKAIFSDEQTNQDKKFILRSWITRKISDFVHTLRQHLQSDMIGRTESIFSHCMYFGLSFSRLGADFRGLLVPAFQTVTLHCFLTDINQATNKFREDIRTFTTVNTSIGQKKRFNKDKTYRGETEPCTPPHELLSFPPVVVYLNAILAAFNNLRQFPAISFYFVVRTTLLESLRKSMAALQDWARLESQSTANANDVRKLCDLVCRHFLTYVKQAFELFYLTDQVSGMVGRLPPGHQTHTFYGIDLAPLRDYLKDYVNISVYNDAIPAVVSKVNDTLSTQGNDNKLNDDKVDLLTEGENAAKDNTSMHDSKQEIQTTNLVSDLGG